MIPRGNWLDDGTFRELVREVTPLHFGSWSLPEFVQATSELGWELREPKEVVGQVWRRFAPRKGPWGGYGTVIADASEPDQVRKLNVRVVDLPAEDTRPPPPYSSAPPGGSWRRSSARPLCGEATPARGCCGGSPAPASSCTRTTRAR